jgi:cold shock protein
MFSARLAARDRVSGSRLQVTMPANSMFAIATTRLFTHSKEALVASGKVKWFNPTKGYGFIQPNDGTRDVFVHISAVERAGLSTLNEGQEVEYEMVTNRGKQSAENLKVR